MNQQKQTTDKGIKGIDFLCTLSVVRFKSTTIILQNSLNSPPNPLVADGPYAVVDRKHKWSTHDSKLLGPDSRAYPLDSVRIILDGNPRDIVNQPSAASSAVWPLSGFNLNIEHTGLHPAGALNLDKDAVLARLRKTIGK